MDKKPKRMVPEVRFKGFTDDWEQRKLKSFYSFKNGINKGKEYFGDGIPIVNYTDVYHHRALESSDLKGRVQVTAKEIENNSAKTGDLFFTRTSETIDEIGFPSVLLNINEKTVFSGFLIRARAINKDPLNNLIKKYIFYTDIFRKEMMKKSTITTRALTSGKNLAQMFISFPTNKNEQNKIGRVLSILDNLLFLQQRKLEQLKQLKKAMLQRLLVSKKGKLIPSIRFKDFTETWDQRKLSELGKVLTGNTPSTKDVRNWTNDKRNGHIWITPTDINKSIIIDSERYLSDKGWSKARVVPKDSVLITSIASIGKNAINAIEAAFNQQINALIIQNNNSYFVLMAMTREKQRFEALAGQTATPIINKSTFSSFTIKLPSKKEQDKIGNFFKQLDSLITLHQCKLNQLSKMKKFYLQKMFI
ncbi:restriction endonuclease subunit S [Limosilactobacillus vaginalis]|uniref:restriction endonuclease subunit S n=1 Tax=Limosilactobacillus vaginalis TaxID=1633 RepID=UPI001F09DB9B|nr:restriction endonuclease subunit S [Limosilactobacillus vaginalis]